MRHTRLRTKWRWRLEPIRVRQMSEPFLSASNRRLSMRLRIPGRILAPIRQQTRRPYKARSVRYCWPTRQGCFWRSQSHAERLQAPRYTSGLLCHHCRLRSLQQRCRRSLCRHRQRQTLIMQTRSMMCACTAFGWSGRQPTQAKQTAWQRRLSSAYHQSIQTMFVHVVAAMTRTPCTYKTVPAGTVENVTADASA